MNNALLDELECTPNVKLFFNHKLTGADFNARKAWFERRVPGEAPLPNSANRVPEIEVDFDFMIKKDIAKKIIKRLRFRSRLNFLIMVS